MTHIQGILRLGSTIACAIVIAAFGMWASDEGRANSDQQVARLAEEGNGDAVPTNPVDPNRPLPAAQPSPAAHHGGVRGAIEDANDALVSPFDHIAQGSGDWPSHIAPLVLALLAYGLLARILIAYLPR
jgi:hypothetical protein